MKNKGITIVEMVIVVIILILLAIIAIWSSRKPSIEAEAAVIYSELKAVHTGLIKIRQEYDLQNFENYTEGQHYNSKLSADLYDDYGISGSGDWHIIYGVNNSNYNEDVIDNLGVDELKRNYIVNFETAEVKFLDGTVKIDEYEVSSYEDMKTLMESGVI